MDDEAFLDGLEGRYGWSVKGQAEDLLRVYGKKRAETMDDQNSNALFYIMKYAKAHHTHRSLARDIAAYLRKERAAGNFKEEYAGELEREASGIEEMEDEDD